MTKPGTRSLRAIALLIIAHMTIDINQGAIPVLLPFFIAAHRISYAAAAALVLAANLASTLTQPLFGHIADRFSKPWLMPIGMLFAGLGVAAVGMAPRYGIGLIAAGFSGLGIAAFHPEAARLTNYFAGERKASTMSFFGVGGQLGFSIGPLLMTAALLNWDLKGTASFILPAVLMAIFLGFVRLRIPAGHGKGRNAAAAQTPAARDDWRAFLRVAALALSRSAIFSGLNTFLPLFWIDVLLQSKVAGGTALTVLFASGIVGNVVGGRIADRYGCRIVVLVGFVFLTLFLPLFALSRDAVLSMVLLIPVGLVLSLSVSPLVVLGQGYLPNRVGFASGVTFGLAVSFGGVTAPLLGWIADRNGLRVAISLVAFLPLLCTAIALTIPRKEAGQPIGLPS